MWLSHFISQAYSICIQVEAIWCTRSNHWSDITACRYLLVSPCCRKIVPGYQSNFYTIHYWNLNSSNCGPNNQKNISFTHCLSPAACNVLCIRVGFCLTVSCLCFSADLKEVHPRRSEVHKRSSVQMWPTTCCIHFSMVFWLLALWGECEHLYSLAYTSDFQSKWIHK